MTGGADAPRDEVHKKGGFLPGDILGALILGKELFFKRYLVNSALSTVTAMSPFSTWWMT